MLKRDLTYLINWDKRKNRKPLILRGARQVGKSTLVRIFARENNLSLVEVNLERYLQLNRVFATFKIDQILAELEAICNTSIDDEKSLIFLDEVQATPNAIAALRYFFEDRPQLRVIAAGSLLEFALSDHSFSMPVGRVDYHWLRPLTFTEFLSARGEDFLSKKLMGFQADGQWPQELHRKFWEQYRTYLVIGGMPEVVSAFVSGAKEESVRNIQDSIIAAYSDDFSKYARRSDLMRLQSVFRKVPTNLGRKVKYSSILTEEKSSDTKRCLDLLAKAGIVQKVFHTDCSGIPLRANIDEKVYKLYMLDVGIFNRMLGVSWSTVSTTPSLSIEGVLAEQFVAQELLAADQSMDPEPLYFWLREGKAANAEVDFVIQDSLDMIPIEVKSGSPGTFKSLVHLVHKTKAKRAFRLSNILPSSQSVKFGVRVGDETVDVHFELQNLPIYMALNIKKHF